MSIPKAIISTNSKIKSDDITKTSITGNRSLNHLVNFFEFVLCKTDNAQNDKCEAYQIRNTKSKISKGWK